MYEVCVYMSMYVCGVCLCLYTCMESAHAYVYVNKFMKCLCI